MTAIISFPWRPDCRLAALVLLLACGDSPSQPPPEEANPPPAESPNLPPSGLPNEPPPGLPNEPPPETLVGEFSGRAGSDLEIYDLFLAVDEVGDSVRGVWSLSFQATCATHDGPFSGVLDGDRLELRLRPDEGYEATLDLNARVLRGGSELTAALTLVAPGNRETGPALCGSDELAPITLQYGEVDWLPIGR